MLVVPYVAGLVLRISEGRLNVASVLLFPTWMIGYFAFNAASLWLKSRRRARYLPPARTYVLITAALGIGVLVAQFSLVWWLPIFAPLLAVGLWCAWRRDERSLPSGAVTVAAACLMLLVVYTNSPADVRWPSYAVAAALACFGYFFGTVLYVKTMIRERGEIAYVAASIGWHVACVVVALRFPRESWLLAAFFAVMLARAVTMPLVGPMRGRTISAKHLGIGEAAASLALLMLLVLIP